MAALYLCLQTLTAALWASLCWAIAAGDPMLRAKAVTNAARIRKRFMVLSFYDELRSLNQKDRKNRKAILSLLAIFAALRET